MVSRNVSQNLKPIVNKRSQSDSGERLREIADMRREEQRKHEAALDAAVKDSHARIIELTTELDAARVTIKQLKEEIVKNERAKRTLGTPDKPLEDPIAEEELSLDKKPALARQKPESKPVVDPKNESKRQPDDTPAP